MFEGIYPFNLVYQSCVLGVFHSISLLSILVNCMFEGIHPFNLVYQSCVLGVFHSISLLSI